MNKRELKRLLGRDRLKAGWQIEPTRKGHWRLTSPGGHAVITGGSDSDRRAQQNFLARIRRAERADAGEDVAERD